MNPGYRVLVPPQGHPQGRTRAPIQGQILRGQGVKDFIRFPLDHPCQAGPVTLTLQPPPQNRHG